MNTNNETNKFYTAKDIQNILRISKNSTYKLLVKPPFKIIKIGKTIRIPKEGFDLWISSSTPAEEI